MFAIYPDIVNAARKRDVELAASLVSGRFGRSDEIKNARVDVAALAGVAGVAVRKMAIRDIGAIAVRDGRGELTVVVALSPAIGGAVERATLAHLLGHLFMHVVPGLVDGGRTSASGFRETENLDERIGRSIESAGAISADAEEMADRFAVALLMPADSFRSSFASNPDIAVLARSFDVSYVCAKWRATQLGLVFDKEASAPKRSEENTIKQVLEAMSSEERKKFSGRELEVMLRKPESSKSAPPTSVAAAAYGRAQSTAGHSSGPHKPQQEFRSASEATSSPLSPKGLERLRTLARKLDSSVP